MSTEEKEGKQRNEEIENQLKRDKLSQRNEIKMLLLGMVIVIAKWFLIYHTNSCRRSWRVRKIYNSKADETDPRG